MLRIADLNIFTDRSFAINTMILYSWCPNAAVKLCVLMQKVLV